ncbi:Do family serine endopeptidase [Novosphingobium sp.]|uniref:Do family serine endopeptidase n=1 Tax=Novosphingobium sp. TaxID=1874826 RepID=UPI0035B2E084
MRYAYGVTSALLLGGATLSLVTGLPAGAQVAQNDSQAIAGMVPRAGAPASFADLTQQLQPAVVNISVRQKVVVKQQQNPLAGLMFGGFGRAAPAQEKLAEALGSGFIISADGYIVTNNHVVSLDDENAADAVTVKLADGTQYNARIVGRDPESDIAVLKVDAKGPLPFVPFGDSGKVRAGDWVIAIGNPFGLGGTVTSGIISSVNRNTGTGAYDHYIQTDASINSGNSGGPMFDMRGNVIGINNWIVAPSGGNIGIGFAIPSDVAKPIVAKLMAGRAIERGFLGVQIQPVTDEIADSIGLPHDSGEVIRGVQPGLPGAAAGLKVGDIVLKVNNEDVTPSRTLSAIVSDTAPGTRVPLDVLREGKKTRLWAVVAKRPSQKELATSLTPASPRDPFATPQTADLVGSALGLKVTDMIPDYADALGVPPNTQGAVVVDVASASDAANRGLGRGAIVVGANFEPVRSVSDLEKAVELARKQGRSTITLQITGPAVQGGTVYLALRLS